MFRKCTCYFCKQTIENEEDRIKDCFGLKTPVNLHKWCVESFEKSRQERLEFDKLYDYIRYNILEYSKGKQLSPNTRNKLQSLRNGSLLHAGDKMSKDGYSYTTILTAFKIKKIDIDKAIYGKVFNSENGKFNYILAIVLNSINDVQMRIERAEEEKKRVDNQTYNIEVKDIKDTFEEYKEIQKSKKEENKVADLLDDLF